MNPTEWAWLLGIPVLVPFVGAAASLLLARHPKAQRVVSVAALSIVLVTAVCIVFLTAQGPMTLDVGGWSAPVGITLVGDRLSAMMLLVSVFVTLGVLIYSLPQDLIETHRQPLAIYQPTFLILSAGVSDAFLTGDLFNMYVGFEILLVSSFVLITLGGTRDRMRSGAIYVVVSLVSSVIFLVALAMVYGAVGTVNMAQISLRMAEVDPGVRLLIQVMLLVAFGVKAAVFPLSAWLPDSYPTAPAPVTAVFAGLLTKVGVYAIIRTQTLLFAGDDRLNTIVLVVGALTMFVGILGAVAQDDIKRLLSFTLVSHIGFMLWGIGTGNLDGLSAAIFYTAHHIIVQTALFLVAGLMERVGGTTSLVKLGSLLKVWPLLGVMFLIPALNLAGIPPMSGFLGKVGLVSASVEAGRGIDWVLVGIGLVCSFLTLYALVRAWNMAFWQPAEEPIIMTKVPKAMTGATLALIAGSLGLTVVAGPLFSYSHGAAAELMGRDAYVSAVLPNRDRGTGQSHQEPQSPESLKPTSTSTVPPLDRTSPSPEPSPSPVPSPTPTGGDEG